MKIHLIKAATLENFALSNAQSRGAIEEWLDKLKHADWEQPADIKKTYNAADLLGKSSHKIVFDLGGNKYRLICKYAFGAKQIHLYICWIGTHAAYSKLNGQMMQYTINNY